MADNRKVDILVGADGSQAKQEFAAIGEAAHQMEQRVEQAGTKGATALDGIAEGAKQAADKTTREAGRLAAAITSATTKVQTSRMTQADAFTFRADQKGVADNPLVQQKIDTLRIAQEQQNAITAQEERAAAAAAAAAQAQKESAAAQAAAAKSIAAAQAAALAEEERAAAVAVRHLQTLRDQRNQLALTAEEFARLKAAEAGAGGAESDALIAEIARLKKLQEEERLLGQQKAKNENGLTDKQVQLARTNLPAQMTDIFVGLSTGQRPLQVLLQQGGQLKDMFGGIAPAARAVGAAVLGLINPYTVAATAIGAFAYAAFQGNRESKALADALTLTGNAVGVTEGRFNELAAGISVSGGRAVGAVREMALALAKTGEIGPEAFTSAVEAAERFAEATDKTAAEVSKDFASMARDPLKWAAETNRSLHFVTLAQYEHIRALQEQGRFSEAQAVISDALNDKLRGLEANLGSIDRVLKAGKQAWSDWWDAAKGFGRAETTEDKLAKVLKRLEDANRAAKAAPGIGAADLQGFSGKSTQAGAGSISRLEAERLALQTRLLRESNNASGEAERSRDRDEQVKASDFVRGMKERTKNTEILGEKLDAAKTKLDKLDEELKRTGKEPLTKEFRARVMFEVEKENIDPRIAANIEVQLAKQVRGIDQALSKEKDRLSAQQAELQIVYNAGELALQSYFDGKRAIIVQGANADAEALAAKARAEQTALNATPALEPAERAKRQLEINGLIEQEAQVRRKAAAETRIAAMEQAAAQKQLTQSVREFEAQLLMAEGRDAEAAALRTKNAIETARDTLRKATPVTTPGQLNNLFDRGQQAPGEERAERLLTLQSDLTEAQKQQQLFAERADIAEQTFALHAQERGLSMQEVEQGLYDIRRKSVDTLTAMSVKADALANGLGPDAPAVQFAQRLHLELEKAQREIDPLRRRLEEFSDHLGDDIGQSIESGILDGDWASAGKSLARALMHGFLTEDITGISHAISDELRKSIPGASGIPALLMSGGRRLLGLSDPLAAFRPGGDTSVAGTVDNPSAARDALRGMEAQAYASTDALAGMADKTGLATTVLGTVGTAGAQPATGAMADLTGAAQIAAAALRDVAASSGSSSFLSAFGSAGAGSGGFGGFDAGSVPLPPNLAANGRAFDGAHTFARGGEFTNKVFNRATPFRFASGGAWDMGVMGEAGPEAILPLRRGANGKLGVETYGEKAGTPGPVVNVNVTGAPTQPKVSTRQRGNSFDIDIAFEQIRDKLASDWANGGPSSRALETTHGTNRAKMLVR